MMARQSFGRYIVQASGSASQIELERLHEVISTRPKVRQLVLHFAEAMMARVLQNVACNAVHSVEERCCRWILSMHDRLDGNTVPLTHEFLADMLGVQRSTVSGITRALQEAGLIRQGRGVITVMDRTGMSRPPASATARCAVASSGCFLTPTRIPRPLIYASRVVAPDRPVTPAVARRKASQARLSALSVIWDRRRGA